MIQEQRDPDFWKAVVSHPAVAHTLHGLEPATIGEIVANEKVLPLASKHGGFLFTACDGFGRVRQLDTLFTPEGWGREALIAGKQALEYVFIQNCDLIITHADERDYRSRPPLSFGFRQCAAPFENAFGHWATWFLPKRTWEQSAARERLLCL